MFKELEKNLGHSFKEPNLLKLALTHRSHGKINNERLEFLGDSLLSAVISEYLYKEHDKFSEGLLSQARALLVNKNKLAELASSLNLQKFLVLGGSELYNDNLKLAIMADAFEAIVGALYIDAGWQKSRLIIIELFKKHLMEIAQYGVRQHPKSSLQEWTQARSYPLPNYNIIKQTGPSHNMVFVSVCFIKGIEYKSQGKGISKQQAEENAAKDFLDWLEKNYE